MTFSTGRSWFGGMAITGLLLASSLPGMYQPTNQAVDLGPELKPILAVQSSQPIFNGIFANQLKVVDNLKTESNKDVNAMAQYKDQEKTVIAAIDSKATINTNRKITEPIVVTQQTAETAAKRIQIALADSKSKVSRGASDQADSIVTRALVLQGIPYVFGGTTRDGFDCSGFTQYVFKASGIDLPRTSYDQFNEGKSINRDELEPGDLVFFSTYNKGASHVGIYIGGGKFVHASNSGVRTTSLSNSYYTQRYLGARRVK